MRNIFNNKMFETLTNTNRECNLLRVDISCGLVHDQYPVVAYDGSSQTHELSLADTHVGATFGHLGTEASCHLVHYLFQLHLTSATCKSYSHGIGRIAGIIGI